MFKKIIITFFAIFATLAGYAQIYDTVQLRQYINTVIVPNSNRAITASQLNTALNGLLNISLRYRGADNTFYTANGVLNSPRTVNGNGKQLTFTDVSNFVVNQTSATGYISLMGKGYFNMAIGGTDNTAPGDYTYMQNTVQANGFNTNIRSENDNYSKDYKFVTQMTTIPQRYNDYSSGGTFLETTEQVSNWTQSCRMGIHKNYFDWHFYSNKQPDIRPLMSLDSTGNLDVSCTIKTGGVIVGIDIIQTGGDFTVKENAYTLLNRNTSGTRPRIILPAANLCTGRILIIKEDIEKTPNEAQNALIIYPGIKDSFMTVGQPMVTNFDNWPSDRPKRMTIQSDGSNWIFISN